jgi:hypothetical protein
LLRYDFSLSLVHRVQARIKSDKNFAAFLASPVVSRKAKRGMLRVCALATLLIVAEGVTSILSGRKYSDTVVNFFGALLNRSSADREVTLAQA